MNWKKIILWGIGALVVFLGIQLVPYERQHENPSVTNEVGWGDPAVREVAVTACYDCHSNETVWPWYSNIAPVSRLIQNDVEEGRPPLLEGRLPAPAFSGSHRRISFTGYDFRLMLA